MARKRVDGGFLLGEKIELKLCNLCFHFILLRSLLPCIQLVSFHSLTAFGLFTIEMESLLRKSMELQMEVLKWLEDLSENLQKGANAATEELHGLVGQTVAVEQDLKTAFNSLYSFSHIQLVEYKIFEANEQLGLTEEVGRKSDSSIPAQNYEIDILPRYREALSLGLDSCKNHFQRRTSSVSAFKTGSRFSTLPHIISSEEYAHDDSCGLVTGDFRLDAAAFRFGNVTIPNLSHPCLAEGESRCAFSADEFVTDLNPSPLKGQDEPLVSAACDFKAMLEAALFNAYKFYDVSGTSSYATVVDNNEHLDAELHATSTASNSATTGHLQQPTDSGQENVPARPGGFRLLVGTDVSTSKACSTYDGLFDAGEPDSCEPRQPFVNIP